MVVCDKGEKAQLLLKAATGLQSLKTLVVIQGKTLTKEIVEAGRQMGINIYSFDDMLKLGRENLHKPVVRSAYIAYNILSSCYLFVE